MDDFKKKTFNGNYWFGSPCFNIAGKRLKRRLRKIARFRLKQSDREKFKKYVG